MHYADELLEGRKEAGRMRTTGRTCSIELDDSGPCRAYKGAGLSYGESKDRRLDQVSLDNYLDSCTYLR